MIQSRKMVKSSRQKIEQCIREQQKYSKRLRDEWVKKSDEMSEQINVSVFYLIKVNQKQRKNHNRTVRSSSKR